MPPKAADKPVASAKETNAKEAPAKESESKMTPARQRDLDAAISCITKAYGDGSIMRLGAAQALRHIEVIPTGARPIDLALGVGGGRGGGGGDKFGPESAGKT